MQTRNDDFDLHAELRALRPKPDETFAADLDSRAAAGFPAAARTDRAGFRRVVAALHLPASRRLVPAAGIAAVAAIALATALISVSEDRSEDPAGDGPSLQSLTTPAADDIASPISDEASSAATAEGTIRLFAQPAARDIERSAMLVLGADPAELRSTASEVFAVVRTYDGIVLRSSIRDGGEGEAAANFELMIPSGRLSSAMAAFSEIAEVRSRSDSTLDITAPTVAVEERIRDSRATIDGLLAQLADSTDEAERERVEAELRRARTKLARQRAQMEALQRRTDLSRVSLRIASGPGSTTSDSGHWGVIDAAGDAVRILGIAAGVTLVAAAVLAPIALIILLAWLARRAWVHRERRRALD